MPVSQGEPTNQQPALDDLSKKRCRQSASPGSKSPAAKRTKVEAGGFPELRDMPPLSDDPEPIDDPVPSDVLGSESPAAKTEKLEPGRSPKLHDIPQLSGDHEPSDFLGSGSPATKMEKQEPSDITELRNIPELGDVLGSESCAAKTEQLEPNDSPELRKIQELEKIPWYRYILGSEQRAKKTEELEPGDAPELRDIPEIGCIPGSEPHAATETTPEPKDVLEPPNFPEPREVPETEMVPLSDEALERLNMKPIPRVAQQDGPKITDIARFARNGGPNLRLIFQDDNDDRPPLPRRGARDYAFCDESIDPLLFHSKIYPICYNFPAHAVPVGLDINRDVLMDPNATFSSDNVTAEDFENFKRENNPADGPAVLANLVKILTGDKPCQPGVPFTNMSAIGRAPVPKPDYFDAAGSLELDSWVLRALDVEIAPTADLTMPVAPNFFLEVRTAADEEEATRTQAYLDGAYGARAMLALQNYGRPHPIYDEKARTYSATFQAGTGLLELNCHHVVKRSDLGLEFHTTYLWGLTLTASLGAFIVGVSIFRNVRESARQKREKLIREANIRATHLQMASTGQVVHPWEAEYDGSLFEQQPPGDGV